MRRIGSLLAFALIAASPASYAQSKSELDHRRGICGEIVKIDLMLYSNPRGHAPTAQCSYNDERLLITSKQPLPDDRMKRFVFLAFIATGALVNDDFRLPPMVYVGHAGNCQVLKTSHTGIMQSDAKSSGDSGMMRSMMSASQAQKVACPK